MYLGKNPGSESEILPTDQIPALEKTPSLSPIFSLCPTEHTLPLRMYSEKIAQPLLQALQALTTDFPTPIPASALRQVIIEKQQEIIALRKKSVKGMHYYNPYRLQQDIVLANKSPEWKNEELFVFLVAIVLLCKGIVRTDAGEEVKIDAALETFLLQQIQALPQPNTLQSLSDFRPAVEKIGVIQTPHLWAAEANILGDKRELFTTLATIIRMHPNIQASRPNVQSDSQKKYDGAMYKQIAPVIPPTIDQWIRHCAATYMYRMDSAQMVKEHAHYQMTQRIDPLDYKRSLIMLREMFIVDFLHNLIGRSVSFNLASSFDDAVHGIDLVAKSPSLGKVGFFDITFDKKKIEEKSKKIQTLIDHKKYEQTEFYHSLSQEGRSPTCHITGGVLYVRYELFVTYIRQYLEVIQQGSNADQLAHFAASWYSPGVIVLYPYDKQANKLLGM